MYLVFDIGGTHTRMAVSWDGASLSDEKVFPTETTLEKALEKMEQVVAEYSKKEPISATAGGIAGVMDAKKNKLFASPNLAGWEGKTVGTKLRKIMGAKLILENDAVMGGLGEANMGSGRRRSVVAFLTIGTGIGGCKLVDGNVDAGAYGFEPGHQIIAAGDKAGYLEEFAGGAGIEKIFGKPPEDIDDPEFWENETRLLAIGIHNATVFWSPEMIVLGGSIMQKIDLENLKGKMEEQMKMFPKLPELVTGELGDKAGLFGSLVKLKRESGRY